jgi:hypothetical protein
MGKHVHKELSAYYHGELPPASMCRVSEHLLGCHKCRAELDEIKFGGYLAGQLNHVQVPDDLWAEIEPPLGRAQGKKSRWSLSMLWPRPAVALAGAIVLVAAVGSAWYLTRPRPSWSVTSIAGTPAVGQTRINGNGKLATGEWLVTDDSSRAAIDVANIGRVEVEPGTRVKLVETSPQEHRLALSKGALEARTWAPPRLFVVDTPSAAAVDYGCIYRLEVDDRGRSRLHVTLGWVSLVLKGRESIVPAGAECDSWPDVGPGTPYYEDAPESFRRALEKLDFENGGDQALEAVLSGARNRDALTLWYLLPRVDGDARSRIYERLVSFVPTPNHVTREGVLRLDEGMLNRWRNEFDRGHP